MSNVQHDPFDENPEARRRAEAAAADAERTRIEDLRWVASSPRGRRFIGWLLNTAGVDRPSFNNSGSITAFNEGLRALGLTVMTEVQKHAFSNYLAMLEEAQAEKVKTK